MDTDTDYTLEVQETGQVWLNKGIGTTMNLAFQGGAKSFRTAFVRGWIEDLASEVVEHLETFTSP